MVMILLSLKISVRICILRLKVFISDTVLATEHLPSLPLRFSALGPITMITPSNLVMHSAPIFLAVWQQSENARSAIGPEFSSIRQDPE